MGKRKSDEVMESSNKKNKSKETNIWDNLINYVGIENNEMVSASSIKNFMLNDPIIDWLDLYHKNKKFNNKISNKNSNNNSDINSDKNLDKQKSNLSILFNNGNVFEKAVIDDIKKNHPKHHVTIGTGKNH
jgi:hypothetical protein